MKNLRCMVATKTTKEINKNPNLTYSREAYLAIYSKNWAVLTHHVVPNSPRLNNSR